MQSAPVKIPTRLPRKQLTAAPPAASLGTLPSSSPEPFGIAARASWLISARCIQPADCVPFLVRVPGPRSAENHALPSDSAQRPQRLSEALSQKPLVHPGEPVTLLWDQDGIRLLVPAVCLDRGGAGDEVRARIEHGGRVVRAVVVGEGRLRATS